jgi:hypothetical protein
VFQWTRNADGSVSQSGGVGAIALAVSNTNVASHTSTHYLRTDATMPPDSHYKTEVTLDGAVAVGACITDAKTFCDSVSISGNATVTIWDGSTVQTNVPASPLRIRKFYARRPGGFTVINGINGTTYTDGVGNALGVPDGPFVNAATSPECRYVAGQGNIGAHDPNTFPIDIEDNGSGLPLFQSICNPVYLNTINVAAATQTKLAFIMPRWCIEKVQAQIIKCDGSNTLMDWTTVPTDQCQIGAAAGRIAHCHSEPDGNNQIGTITNVDGCQSGGCTGIIWLFTYHDMQTFGWMELDETTCGDCTVICNNLAP